MGIEAIAIGVFLFVAFAVGSCRALDALRAAPAIRKTEVTSYTGPVYTGRDNLGE